MSESGASTPSAAVNMPEPEDCNRLGILVEEAEYVQSQECFSWGPEKAYKRHICMAATSGNWVEASSYHEIYPNWACTPLTEDGDTVLHIAVSMEHTHLVKKLVDHISTQDMEIVKADGNTAFCMAAISGNVEIATILLCKNPKLTWIKGHEDMLPIQLASLTGQHYMVEFLFERTRADMHIISFEDIVRIFFLALTNSIYVVASNLLDKYPKLAGTENESGLTALEVLAQLSFDKGIPGYQDILNSLFKLMEEQEFPNSGRTSKAMFDAAKSGNAMILKFIIKCKPNLLLKVNSNGQSLLHIAILYRQISIYRLILSKGAYKNAILRLVDHEGNNVLHMAGKLAAEGRFGSPICQVLICSEELWFKRVEEIVPPALKIMENRKGCIPEELFFREHKDVSEKAISELNGMANNFIVVGTLLVTLGITAGLTIRTNNIEGQTPIFKQKTWYIIFLISVAFGVSFSAVSMLLFASVIVPAIWKQKQVTYQLIRMTCGLLLLYASVGIMGTISVMSGAILVYTFFPKWIFCVIAAVSFIPLMLSFVIYGHSLHLSLYFMILFYEDVVVKFLSRMGIKCAPFNIG